MIYCGACGMPPEFCEYGPDYETHCLPWLRKYQPELANAAVHPNDDNGQHDNSNYDEEEKKNERPSAPWTTEERLVAVYTKYQPNKLDGVGGILEKYSGREDKLFLALVKKYGPEPSDPYYGYSSSDYDSSSSVDEDLINLSLSSKTKKKRRGASAKKVHKVDTRVIIQKISRNKRKAVTVVVGMDTVPSIKLKDVAKDFSKRFAGSSSVKDIVGGVDGGNGIGRKEIIVQGDHVNAVAIMMAKKYGVDKENIFLDIDGDIVAFGG